MPRGTKFYRVKVKPLTSSQDTSATALASSTIAAAAAAVAATTSSQMSQSQVVAHIQHDIVASVYDASQSLSVPNTPTRPDDNIVASQQRNIHITNESANECNR